MQVSSCRQKRLEHLEDATLWASPTKLNLLTWPPLQLTQGKCSVEQTSISRHVQIKRMARFQRAEQCLTATVAGPRSVYSASMSALRSMRSIMRSCSVHAPSFASCPSHRLLISDLRHDGAAILRSCADSHFSVHASSSARWPSHSLSIRDLRSCGSCELIIRNSQLVMLAGPPAGARTGC